MRILSVHNNWRPDDPQRQADDPPEELLRLQFRWRHRVMRDKRMTAKQCCVLYGYASRVTSCAVVEEWNETGKVVLFGRQSDLAQEARCCINTLRSTFRTAVGYGYLELSRRSRQSGESDCWRVTIPKDQVKTTPADAEFDELLADGWRPPPGSA